MKIYSFKKGLIILLSVLMILVSACTVSNDKPPQTDKALPSPLNGDFKSGLAHFSFNGDGESVFVDFEPSYALEIEAPNNTHYHYVFMWYNFGKYRYDLATRLVLTYEDDDPFILDFVLDGNASETMFVVRDLITNKKQVFKKIN